MNQELTQAEAKRVDMRPIIFSSPMVQAILAGRKTQTRRIIKSRHESGLFRISRRMTDNVITSIESLDWDERNCEKDITCPYGKIGDILWVRENFKVQEVQRYFDSEWQNNICIDFPASEGTLAVRHWFKMRESERPKVLRRRHPDKVFTSPNIHLPEKCARLFLKITDISVERLQDITEEDAIAEGVETIGGQYKNYCGSADRLPTWKFAQLSFKSLWQSINGPDSWEQNPWIWKISFERIEIPTP